MSERNVIDALEEKIGRLIADNRRLRGDCEACEARCERLQAENRSKAGEIAALRGRIARLELARGLAPEGEDRRQARLRINRLMREIDRCIALMNR